MRIAVIGANGKEGSLIVKEAISRGIDVTSIVRSTDKATTDNYIVSDVFDLTKEDLAGFDALVDAMGFFGEHAKEYAPAVQKLIDLLTGTKTRLLIVGGAGLLWMDKTHTSHLYEQDYYPDIVKPISASTEDAINELEASGIAWTFISPAQNFIYDRPRTGKYVLRGSEVTYNGDGQSNISYADFAVAMVDEVEAAKHIDERVSARY